MAGLKIKTPLDSLDNTTDQERRQVFLRYINRAWLALGIVSLASIPIFPQQRSEFIFLIAIIFPTYLIIRFLNLSGRTKIAGIVFSLAINFGFYGLFMTIVGEVGASKAFETETNAWLLMGLAVLFAGALVDKWAAPALAALNSILLIGTQLAIAPESVPRPSALVFWWMMALIVWLYEDTLHEALRHSWAEVVERKQTEEALRTSEELYRTLFETASVGIGVADLTGNLLTFNDAILLPGGYIREDFQKIGSVQALYYDPNQRLSALQLFGKQGFLKQHPVQFKRKNGKPYDALLSLTPIQFEGKPCVQALVEDVTERKLTDEALRGNEKKYRDIYENVTDVIYATDNRSHITSISPSVEKQTGFGPQELIERNVADFFVDPQQYAALDTQMIKNGSINDFEALLQRKDGSQVFVSISAHIIFDENGKGVATAGILRDITERKQMEEALKETEDRFRQLGEAAFEGIAITEKGHVVDGNSQLSQMLGYGLSEMIGKPVSDFIAPESHSLVLEMIRANNEKPYEHSLLRKDGSIFPVESHAKMITWKGKPLRVTALRDVTERKQAEELLKKSEEKYRDLYENNPLMLFTLGMDGTILGVNYAATEQLEYKENEMVGESVLKVFYPGDHEKVLKTFNEFVEHPIQTAPWEFRKITKSGKIIWVSETSRIIQDGYGNSAVLIVCEDISGRKQTEQIQVALYKIANVTQTAASLNDLFASIHKTLGTLMPADNFYIAIYDSQKDLLSFPYFIDEFDQAPAPQKPVNGLTEYVLHSRQPLLATPPVFEEMIKNKQVDLLGVASFDWIGVPLSIEDETFGVMVVQTYTDKIRLTQKDLELLTFVSTQAAMVIKRKQAEESLLQFREIMDESNDAIYFIDPDTSRYLDFNKNAMDFLGYNKEDLSQRGVIDIAEHIHNMEEWRARVDLIRKNDGLVFQTSYRRKNDTVFPVEVSARLLERDGKPIMVAVVRDITERNQAEAARERQLQELTGLHAIASACAFAVDEDSLLTVISIIIGEVLFPDDFGFFMADKAGLLRPHSSYHQKNGDQSEFIRPGEGLIGQAALEGRARRSGDVRLEKNYIIASPTSLSELAVPVKINDQVLGVINTESDMLNAFSEADERLLTTAADQIATAFERIRLQNETAQRAKEFTSLYETSTSLSAETNLNALLQIIVEHAATLLNASHGTIYLFNESTQNLETVVATSTDIPVGTHLNLGEGAAGRTAQTQLPIRIDDYSTWEGRAPKFDGLIFHAVLEVPMVFGGELIGVITAAEMGESKRKFTEADERLLSLFATQAAGAIHSAKLREETAQRAQEFASLYETSNALSAENNLTALLQVIVEHAATLLNASTGTMYLFNKSAQDLETVVTTSLEVPIGLHLRLGEGLAGRAAQKRIPLRIDDYSTWEDRSRKYEGSRYRAILGVPMLFGGELIGVLNAAEMGESNRKFTEADERLLSLFAAQAAGAIHSARLGDETARRAREFASLYETSNALSAENELNSMLQVIVEHAKKLLDSASSGMYLYLSETDELELTVDTAPYLPFGTRLKLSEGVAGRVAQTHQSIRIDDYSTWEGRSPLYDGASIRAVLEVPMLYGGELIGVLTADEVGDSERKFTEADEHLLSLFASQAAGAIHSARLRQQTTRRLDQLQALYTIDRAISSYFDMHPILDTVISQTIAHLGVDAAAVLLFHPNLQTLEYVAGQGFYTHAIEKTQLRLGEGFAGRAAFERRTIHIPSLPEAGSNFARASLLKDENFLEYYAVPLIAKGELKGILEVFQRTPLPHNIEWQDFLETLAGQAAITLDQTQLFDNLQRANLDLMIAYDATIEGWSHAMDLRDKETEGHTLRVTEMTITLSTAIGINKNEMLHIKHGALLHDIGKMGVPDNILLKEKELTEEEWVLMRRHPQFAYEMLRPIKYLQQSLDIPYCHHEKWDGTGYPRGLQNEQIPLVARIFAIVDVWDAVTMDRPYRKAWTKQKALKYIRDQSGKHFDPMVVTAFLKLFGTKTRGPSRKSIPANKPARRSANK